MAQPLSSEARKYLEEKGWLTLNQLVAFLTHHYPVLSASYPKIKRDLLDTEILDTYMVGSQRRITAESVLRYIDNHVNGVGATALTQPSTPSEINIQIEGKDPYDNTSS